MEQQPWMLFKVEGTGVHYLWEGDFPVLVFIGTDDGMRSDWYWAGTNPKELKDKEIKLLNEMAIVKRKKIFKFPGKERRMLIVAQGIFEQN